MAKGEGGSRQGGGGVGGNRNGGKGGGGAKSGGGAGEGSAGKDPRSRTSASQGNSEGGGSGSGSGKGGSNNHAGGKGGNGRASSQTSAASQGLREDQRQSQGQARNGADSRGGGAAAAGGGGNGRGNQISFHDCIREIGSEEPLASQSDAYQFVKVLCRHREPEELAKLLIDRSSNGSERLRDLLGPNVQMIVNPSLVRDTLLVLSFQRVIIPLLRLLTSDDVRKSIISEWTNPLYAMLHNMGSLELRLAKLFEELTSHPEYLQGSPGPFPAKQPQQHNNGIAALLPHSWVDIAQPLALLMQQIANRIEGAAAKPDFQQAFDILDKSIETWEARGGPSGMDTLGPILRGIRLRVDSIRSRIALGDEQTREEEKEKLRRKSFSHSRASTKGPGAEDSATWDGPGELSFDGTPRHNNDAIQIEDIEVDPTKEELTCEKGPYLPRNDGSRGAKDGEEVEVVGLRHLETHFRLLRHEMVGPLQEGLHTVMHALAKKGDVGGLMKGGGGGGGKKKGKKGNKASYVLRGPNTMSYLFHDARVESCGGNQGAGVYFTVHFALPEGVTNMKVDQLKEFWERKQVLMVDSLVLVVGLSHDGELCVVSATVAQRDVVALSKDRPSIGLACSLGSGGEHCFRQMLAWMPRCQSKGKAPKEGESLTIIQTQSNYVGVAPILRALQSMARNGTGIPMAKYLIMPPAAHDEEIDVTADLPPYLREKRYLDLRCLANLSNAPRHERDRLRGVDVHYPDSFPMTALGQCTTLELSQMQALKSMLTQPVALIQGPPGTGKTYIGVKVVEVLVKNFATEVIVKHFHKDGQMIQRRVRQPNNLLPIVCVCYTNHALDQFLESLLDVGIHDIVRIGGGSKSERLKGLNLREVLPYIAAPLRHARDDIKRKLLEHASELDACRAVLSAQILPLSAVNNYLGIHNSAYLESIIRPSTDKDGFMAVELDKKSEEERWKLWLEPPRDPQPVENVDRKGRRKKGGRKNRDASPAREEPRESYYASLAHMNDDGEEEDEDKGEEGKKEDREGEKKMVEPSPSTYAPAPAITFPSVVLGQRMIGQEGAASTEQPPSPPPPSPPPPPRRSAKEILRETSNAWTLEYEERMILYRWIEQGARAYAQEQMERLAKKFRALHQEAKSIRERIDLEALKTATIIGLTTTGASKQQNLLSQLGVKIIVVEEAAEVLEGHVLACLSDSIQQIILIGDHLQLRPKVETYQLTASSGQGFNLDISLFERLAIGSSPETSSRGGRGGRGRGARDRQTTARTAFPIVQLKEQRRMRPDIADLIRLEVYPDLKDHPSLHEYPSVSGMRSNLFFLTHKEMEDAVNKESGMMDDGVSKSNRYELEMVVGLTHYLLKQGYAGGEITVLTPYLKQLQDLRGALSRITVTYTDERDELALEQFESESDEDDSSTKAEVAPLKQATAKDRVRTATIDNFQGEESTIIIISLVRSNPTGRIGFLNMANRVNVLLSRAKHGMYLVGNAETLTARPNGNSWPAVIDRLERRDQLGPAFPLVCSRHPDRIIDVNNPGDFEKFAQNGGCILPCDERMPCGHACPLICHPKVNLGHQKIPCAEPCARLCPNGHACHKHCSDSCGLCQVEMPAPGPLPCGHRVETVPCHMLDQLYEITCREIVTVKPVGCSHEFTVPCARAANAAMRMNCPEVCGQRLTCSHICQGECGICQHNKERSADITLQTPIAPVVPCYQICGKPLSCGHTCALLCHANTDGDGPPTPCSCNQPCQQACIHSRCGGACNEVCVPCAMECDWECEHQGPCHMPCSAPCDRPPCDQPCSKLLECGHACPSICGERCPPPSHCHVCASDEVKGTIVDLIMITSYGEHDPKEEPVIILQCGHIFTLSTLDAHVKLAEYYTAAEGGESASLSLPAPLSAEFGQMPVCPNCRGSLTSIKRYGRPIKKALADNTQKKHIQVSRQQLNHASTILQDLETGAHAANGLPLSSHAQQRLKECEKILDHLCKTLPPTNAVYQASAAAAQRLAMADEYFRIRIMQPPDAAISIEASILRLKATAISIESKMDGDIKTVRQSTPKEEQYRAIEEEVYKSPYYRRLVNQLETGLRNTRTKALAAQHRRLEARASFQLARVLANLGRKVRNLKQKEEIVKEAIHICKGLEKHELRSIRGELGPLAQEIRTTLEQRLTDQEVRQVMEAIARTEGGTSAAGYTGHWFTCPNGHPYVIGECGGAMQQSSCPECGAVVGGTFHRLNAFNRPATELVHVLNMEQPSRPATQFVHRPRRADQGCATM